MSDELEIAAMRAGRTFGPSWGARTVRAVRVFLKSVCRFAVCLVNIV